MKYDVMFFHQCLPAVDNEIISKWLTIGGPSFLKDFKYLIIQSLFKFILNARSQIIMILNKLVVLQTFLVIKLLSAFRAYESIRNGIKDLKSKGCNMYFK